MKFLQLFQEYRTQAIVLLVVGMVLGLFAGLFYAWQISPVVWENATPGHLRSDYMSNYLLLVAEQYENDGDQAAAREKMGMEFWEEEHRVKVFEALDGLIETQGGEVIVRLRILRDVLGGDTPVAPTEPGQEPVQDPADGGGSLLGSLLPICGVAVLVLVVVGAIVVLIRRRGAAGEEEPEPGTVVAGVVTPSADTVWGVEGPPLIQFSSPFVMGDDHYDPSFSIELESGEFMGECGVGVSEILGTGTPNKVTAFEVWLFDKSDIRTVTKVVMSDYAFGDDALKTKLAPKGDPVLAAPGGDSWLETKTLRVRVSTAKVEYAADAVPANSVFDKLTVELSIWVVSDQGGAQPEGGVDDYVIPDM